MTATGRREIDGRSIRWDQARADAAYAEGWWVRETIVDAAAREAARNPARVLLIDGDVRLDAGTLKARAEALAQAMLARAPPASVVSFMLPNWHEAAVIYLAATMAGMVAHPVLPSLRERELTFMLDDARSRFLFIPANFRGHDYAAMMGRVLPRLAEPPMVVVLRGNEGEHRSYDSLCASGVSGPLPALDPDAVRMILYTSGTTGRPKGVMHSHNSLHAMIRQIGRNWLVEPGDRFLVPSPISHIGGSIYAFEAPLLLGTTAVLMDRWDANEAVRLSETERWTHIAGATPFLEQMLAASEAAGTTLPHLKLFVCGGASVPPSLIRRAAGRFTNASVTRVYGSTEVPTITVGVTARAEADRAADTDGRIGIAQVKPANGGEGEVLARGPQMLVGYLRAEDEEGAFDEEGYFQTGDLARRDDDLLTITGRAKDIIIRNGENIAPKEIEDLLIEHPAIAEIAIIGLPDARTGERACAVIVPRGEARPDVADLRTFLRARGVAPFKIPEQVELRASLPRNDAGKVLKHEIRRKLSPVSDR